MKVCVITIIDYKNYGNRLQNFALNKILEDLGVEVVNGLEFFSKSNWLIEQENSGKNTYIMKKIPIRVLAAWYSLRKKVSRNNKQYNERIRKLYEFTKVNMKTFPYLYVENEEDLKRQIDDESIDYYIVGSDQVWNPYYEGHDFEFLTFTESRKKGSFSASFGVSDLPKEYKARYAIYLRAFNNLSVREKSGQDIVKELINREAHISVDPTLLLRRSEWEQLIKTQDFSEFEEEYIATYFLGDVPKCIIEFATENHMKIYCLNDVNSPALFGAGIEVFLYLIKNAKFVVTDSFHATVFSLIFNTDFYVFNRSQDGVKDMFTRLHTLLELFNLRDRECVDNEFYKGETISKAKWELVNQILNTKREEEMEYLSKLLEIDLKGGEDGTEWYV